MTDDVSVVEPTLLPLKPQNIYEDAMKRLCALNAAKARFQCDLGCALTNKPPTKKGEDTSTVHVVSVRENSPAHKAGVLQWDVVTEVNGKRVSSVKELRVLVRKEEVGSEIKMSVRRGEKNNATTHSLTISLGYKQGEEEMALSAKRIVGGEVMYGDWVVWAAPLDESRAPIAMSSAVVSKVFEDLKRVKPEVGIGFVDGPEGVHIIHVLEDSSAEDGGLMVYDVIKKINGVALKNAKQFKQLLTTLRPGDVLNFFIHRGQMGGGLSKGEIEVTVGSMSANHAWLTRAHRVCSGVVLTRDLGAWT